MPSVILKKLYSALTAALGLSPPLRVSARPGEPPTYATAFDKAFVPNFSIETTSTDSGETLIETVPFKIVEAGSLALPSGRVCAADPFIALSDAKPFTQSIPIGTFPVRLALADFPSGGTRITFARVDFKHTPVVRWSMAVVEKQDVATLKDNEIFGYGVDTGTGSFFDPTAGKVAAELLKADENVWETWQTEGEANGPKVIGPYSFLLNLPLGEANAIMFHSGWGDGFYASWFGYDVDGNVAVLITDFQTVDWNTAQW